MKGRNVLLVAGFNAAYASIGKGKNIIKCTILSIGIPNMSGLTSGNEDVGIRHRTATAKRYRIKIVLYMSELFFITI
jgi:hypothetical protein